MTREKVIEKLKTQMDIDYQYWGDIEPEDIVELLEQVGLAAVEVSND